MTLDMSIEEILSGVRNGTLSQELAALLLHDMIQLSHRAAFASSAMRGCLSTGKRYASPADLARECFEYADAMAEAKTVPLPPAPAPVPTDEKKKRTRETSVREDSVSQATTTGAAVK